jgi:hypothetical protein
VIGYAERERKAAARRCEAAHRAELITAAVQILIDRLSADDLERLVEILFSTSPIAFREALGAAADALDFRAKYGRPPGREHIDDLFSAELNPRSRR